MNNENSMHPGTSPFPFAHLPRRRAATGLLGGVVRIVLWVVLWAAFWFDVSLPAHGARTSEVTAATTPWVIARASSAPPPCSR